MMIRPHLGTTLFVGALLASGSSTAALLTEDFEGGVASDYVYFVANESITGTAFTTGDGWARIISQGDHGNVLNLPLGWYAPSYDPGTSAGTGMIRSTDTFDLLAGHTYTLAFDLSTQGWSAGNGPFNWNVVASFGNHAATDPILGQSGFYYGIDWQHHELVFTPQMNLGDVPLVFSATGYGYSGIILDNITAIDQTTVVPLPATLWLFAGGLASMLRWRRS